MVGTKDDTSDRAYDRLSAQDTSFLFAETPTAHMHVGSLVIFEDKGIGEEELIRHIESRLHLVPRFRQKLAWVPGGGGWPVWVDDPDFDLRFHIRHTGLARPGGRDQLLRLMGRLMSVCLDRERPLWELWLVDLPEGRQALVQKTHHCLIDGVSGIDLGTVLLDFSPDQPASKPKPWTPRPGPSRWGLFVDTWRDRLTKPSELVAYVKQMSSRAADQEHVDDLRRGMAALGRTAVDVAPKTSLNQPIGPHRRFDTVAVELSAIKAIKNSYGCKVNDVVLAVVSGALRHILSSRGETVDGMTLKALIPVSVRDPSQRHTYGNKVSMMMADLPVGEADPAERLRLVAARMAGLKESKQAVGADFWVKMAEFAPPTVLSLASRAVALQRHFNLTVTNVPGPQFPLYLMGGRVLEAYPYVPLIGTVATSVAVMSYNGRLFFGLSGDWDVMTDLHILAEGLTVSIDELSS